MEVWSVLARAMPPTFVVGDECFRYPFLYKKNLSISFVPYFADTNVYPGLAVFFQNALIFFR